MTIAVWRTTADDEDNFVGELQRVCDESGVILRVSRVSFRVSGHILEHGTSVLKLIRIDPSRSLKRIIKGE